jgi:cytochrome c biogenesis protein
VHTTLSLGNDNQPAEGGAGANGASRSSARRGFVAVFSSARLTLWLLAILTVAMAIATVIPQRAPEQAYLRTFGTLLGPLIAKTTLHNIYGSWWFVGAFAVLALNLLACSIRRARQLVSLDRVAIAAKARGDALAGGSARWRLLGEAQVVADRVSSLLRSAGYSLLPSPAERDGRRCLMARRGVPSLWSPVIIHIGLIIILIGAAWGHLPSHTYNSIAMLGPGEAFPVTTPSEAFSLRLKDAGAERAGGGQGVRYWASVEVLEEGQVVRSQTIEPNRPLRYHGVSTVLQSVMPAGYQVQVSKGNEVATVPVTVAQDGQVDMMAAIRRLDDPPWIVFVHSFRQSDESGTPSPAARVFVDRSGSLSHNWQAVGWVGLEGLDYEGVHFVLVSGAAGAQLSLDRDIGVPIVYLGFIIVSLGAMLGLGSPYRMITASVGAKGTRGELALALAPASDEREIERLGKRVESELGGERIAGGHRSKEASCAE